MRKLFDFANSNGRNLIQQWKQERGLSKRDCGSLNQRLRFLEAIAMEDALKLSLLNGPLRGHGNLYKLRAEGDAALRPHLCAGPLDYLREYTILAGAVERDRKLHPGTVAEDAVEARDVVAAKGEPRRLPHVAF